MGMKWGQKLQYCIYNMGQIINWMKIYIKYQSAGILRDPRSGPRGIFFEQKNGF